MANKNYILLSHDGDISLYRIDENIQLNLDEYLEAFDQWRQRKGMKAYDDSTFADYIKKRYGEDAIMYCKKVGRVGGKVNQYTGKIEDDIEEEYRDIQWHNF